MSPLLLFKRYPAAFQVEETLESPVRGYSVSTGSLARTVSISAESVSRQMHGGQYGLIRHKMTTGKGNEVTLLFHHERFTGVRGMQVDYHVTHSQFMNSLLTWTINWDSGSEGYLTASEKLQDEAILGFPLFAVDLLFPRSQKQSGNCVLRVFGQSINIVAPR